MKNKQIKSSLSSPPIILAVYCLIIGLWSLIGAADFWTWVFEIYVGVIAVVLVLFTYKRFPLSNLMYVLIGSHFTILAIGAHYTYAEMPLFNWLKETFSLSRNHYDRVGHFMQGFVPAIFAREILIRVKKFKPSTMLGFICVCIPLALSAFWEILETAIVLLFYKTEEPNWLGIQGDIWDPQWDMALALIGATLAILLLSRMHNSSIKKVLNKNY
jgi:putative membrane protein